MKYKFAFCFCLFFALFCKVNAQVNKVDHPVAGNGTSKPLRDEKDSIPTKSLVRIKVSPDSKFTINNVQLKPGTYSIAITNYPIRTKPKCVKVK